MSIEEKMLVVVGPTASGKTALAVRLASEFGGEVVSADSMQIYKGMNIGTAKPTAEETKGIPHHMMDILPPEQKFSVTEYVAMAREKIEDIYSSGKLPVVAGGTGLYVDSLISGVKFPEIGGDEAIRTKLRKMAEQQGGAALKGILQKADPKTAERLYDNDVKRIIRALEVYLLTGEPLSLWEQRSREEAKPYHPIWIGLRCRDRATLYERVNLRVDRMLEQGLAGEVKALLDGGLPAESTSMQAIGYKELAAYFNGRSTYGEAVDKIKLESRRYAKRQLTWFRRNDQIHWFDIDVFDGEIIYKKIKEMVEKASTVW